MRTRDAAAGGDDPAGGLDAVHARHPDVHQDDVGRELGGSRTASRAVGGLADDSMSGCASRIMRKPVRSSGWSSASRTRDHAAPRPSARRACDAPAAVRARARPRACRRRRPRARACRSGPARPVGARGARRRAVVGDLDLDAVGVVAQADAARVRPAPACLSVLVSASWTMPVDGQLAPAPSAAGRRPTVSSVHRQAGRADLLEQRVELRQPGLGRAARPSPSSSRRTPSSRRISVSAWRPVRDTVLHRRRGALGSRSAASRRRRPARSSPTGCGRRCRASRARCGRARRRRRAGPAGRARARAARRAPPATPGARRRLRTLRPSTRRPSPGR